MAIPFTASSDIIENITLNDGYHSGYEGRFTFPNLGTYTVYVKDAKDVQTLIDFVDGRHIRQRQTTTDDDRRLGDSRERRR